MRSIRHDDQTNIKRSRRSKPGMTAMLALAILMFFHLVAAPAFAEAGQTSTLDGSSPPSAARWWKAVNNSGKKRPQIWNSLKRIGPP